MPSKRFYRPRSPFFSRILRVRNLPRQALSAAILILIWLMVCALLAILPGMWSGARARKAQEAFYEGAHHRSHALVEQWSRPFTPPEFSTGDEPGLRASLNRDPLVSALVDLEARVVWVRRQDLLVPGAGPQDREQLLAWAAAARDAGKPVWIPSLREDPRALEESSLVLPGGKWWVVKTWRPGSAEVEAFLKGFLGIHSRFRFGIIHWNKKSYEERVALRAKGPPLPSGSLQAGGGEAYGTYQCLGVTFGDAWTAVISMTPGEMASFMRSFGRWKRLAWTFYGLTVGLSGLALFLYMHARYRERLEADRLASLTHSLKTPLAILKLRCDTARNRSLPRERQEAYLTSIGEEVDQLVQVIETGLENIRPKMSRSALDRIDMEFFESLDGDLRMAFEEAEREMDLEVRATDFLANEQALHAALATLLENALMHGEGAVELRAERQDGLVVIQVRDQGPGVSLDRLDSIFVGGRRVHIRREALESRRGQGLGLFLLAQLAEREGWGLVFASNPGKGFSAILEIRQ